MRLFRQSMTGITSKDMAQTQRQEDAGVCSSTIPDEYALCPHCLVLVPVELNEKGKPEACSNCGNSLRESLKTVPLVRVHWHTILGDSPTKGIERGGA